MKTPWATVAAGLATGWLLCDVLSSTRPASAAPPRPPGAVTSASALAHANRKDSICDIHDIDVRSFEYPRAIRLWQREMRTPMFNADNGGYVPHPALYADLDGNGQIEAIVQLTRGATTVPVGDCSWRGNSSLFVFEMDAKCVVHRLAWIKGSSFDSYRIKGKTLLVDQPHFTSSGDGASCKQLWVGHFVWRFKAGKLRSM